MQQNRLRAIHSLSFDAEMAAGSLINPEEPGTRSKDENQFKETLLRDFEYDWYVRVKFQFSGLMRVGKAAAIAKMETEAGALLEGWYSEYWAVHLEILTTEVRSTRGVNRMHYQYVASETHRYCR